MLSYMNEQDDSKKLNINASEVEAEDVPKQTNDPSQDHIKLAEHGKNARQSTTILAVLFAVGVLCLWVMVKKVVPAPADAAASQQEMQIEEAIAQLTGIRTEVDTKMDSLVGNFYEFSKVEQVKAHDLKRNPFRHSLGFGGFSQGMGDFGISKEMLVAEEIRDRGEQMELFSVMRDGNGVGSCMIEDKLLNEGDSINGFKVRKIGSKQVELEHNETIVTLKMAE